MTLLARRLPTPLAVDIRHGAVAGLCPLLAERRISTSGQVAVAVGPGQGEGIAALLAPTVDRASIHLVEGGRSPRRTS
jgi:glycerol-1-phosphate dehydrogenase [NAD(P)+]